ncbi:MAG: antibiotic biosynthesis monooxygenase [Oscillospiraceae bacterium]|nr:antibiotic biosynthesis monooxygenase [Oscillospiraceae bacterium]
MSKAVFFNLYKLKKGASIPDFLLAVEKLTEHTSKEKGCISFNLFVDGETWADMSTWETMDDAKNFANSGGPKDLADKFYSFININSCRSHFFETIQ